MAAAHEEVHAALEAISAARLPHPSGPLLESFVNNALQPQLAARYARRAIDSGDGSLLASDWTYIVECGESGDLKSGINPA
jgi:hypothetical protein